MKWHMIGINAVLSGIVLGSLHIFANQWQWWVLTFWPLILASWVEYDQTRDN